MEVREGLPFLIAEREKIWQAVGFCGVCQRRTCRWRVRYTQSGPAAYLCDHCIPESWRILYALRQL